MIDRKTEEVVKSEGFATIERSLLEDIVKRESLNIREEELFQAVDLWATKECERQGLAADGSVKRRILGEEIVKGIRFATMEGKDFASFVIDNNVLAKEDVYGLVKDLNGVVSAPQGFQKTDELAPVSHAVDLTDCSLLIILKAGNVVYHSLTASNFG